MKKNDEETIKTEKPMPKPSLDLNEMGGSKHEVWNSRILHAVAGALPVTKENALIGVFAGIIDIKPEDPIEGILVGQLAVAHEAALAMYKHAWSQPEGYFEARTKYLQLADKAQRTVIMLTERIDHHRGRGRQEINVKHQHITVNADQAIVGNVEHQRGGGPPSKLKEQPHAITHAPGITMPSADKAWQPVPVARDEERTVPDARRNVTGRPKGK